VSEDSKNIQNFYCYYFLLIAFILKTHTSEILVFNFQQYSLKHIIFHNSRKNETKRLPEEADVNF